LGWGWEKSPQNISAVKGPEERLSSVIHPKKFFLLFRIITVTTILVTIGKLGVLSLLLYILNARDCKRLHILDIVDIMVSSLIVVTVAL